MCSNWFLSRAPDCTFLSPLRVFFSQLRDLFLSNIGFASFAATAKLAKFRIFFATLRFIFIKYWLRELRRSCEIRKVSHFFRNFAIYLYQILASRASPQLRNLRSFAVSSQLRDLFLSNIGFASFAAAAKLAKFRSFSQLRNSLCIINHLVMRVIWDESPRGCSHGMILRH